MVFMAAYLIVVLGVTIPTWTYMYKDVQMTVHCDQAGDLSPGCSAARWVDLKLIGYIALSYIHAQFRSF